MFIPGVYLCIIITNIYYLTVTFIPQGGKEGMYIT